MAAADIKRILTPIDFSETSEHAVRYAIDLARRLGAEVHFVHVYQLPIYALPEGGMLAGPDAAGRLMEKANELMGKVMERHRNEGVTLHSHVTEGMPHNEVVRLGHKVGADLIIMGTHGRSGLGHLLLGSVAERVIRTSSIPVLAVRHPESKAHQESESH